ncbi:MAG: benzoate-CoA ligase family protein [Desulfotomaculaceae bacterium]|nr:benzoate-CoA ligase family protein [Desulfotomaculaceae bacterium]
MLRMPVIPDEFNITSYMLDRHLEEGRGNNIAIYYEDETYTYAQVAEGAARIGNALLNLGLERENRVLICLNDSPEFIMSLLGAMKAGIIPVLLSTMATARDYLYYLNDSRAKAMIIDEDIVPLILEVKDEIKHLKHLIVRGNPGPGQLSYNEITKAASPNLETVATSKDDPAFWLYSSGTTGQPKGIVHLHHDLMYLTSHCDEVVKATPDDISFSISKMYFSYGRNNSFDTVFLSGGAVVLYPGMPRPANLIEVVKKYRPTIYYGVPTSYMGLLALIDKGADYDFSSVRAFVSAGEALPRVVFDRWKELFGIEILDGLGSSDVGTIYLSATPGNVKPGSLGKLLSNYEGKLCDEDGNEVPRGEAGNLWVKCEGTAQYYWNKHQKTKECFIGEWFITGDKFYQDEEGYFYGVGRADDMLKAGGIWVSPIEVEDAMLHHEAVAECAVIGAADKDELVKPMAFAVLKEGYEGSPELEKSIQNFVRDNIAHYKAPRWIRFVTELPRTATGKIQRYKLRDQVKNQGI